jgi:hypothetical protein
MKIDPLKILWGDYHIVPRNNICVPYLLDRQNRVYRIEGDLTLCEKGGVSEGAIRKMAAFSFHPTEEMAVFLIEGGFAAGDFSGNILWNQSGAFDTVLFSESGKEIWAAKHIGKDRIGIQAFSLSGALIAEKEIADELYGSHLWLFDIPHSEDAGMQLAAGQDGVKVLRLRLDRPSNAITEKEMFPGTSCVEPVWFPDTKQLLTLENDEGLFCRYSWPELSLAGKQAPDEYEGDDEEFDEGLEPGFSIIALDEETAIIQNCRYQYYLFDAGTMTRGEEIKITGFEPRPTNDFYPSLTDDTAPFSPIMTLAQIGNLIVGQTGEYVKEQAVLLFRREEILKMVRDDGK